MTLVTDLFQSQSEELYPRLGEVKMGLPSEAATLYIRSLSGL